MKITYEYDDERTEIESSWKGWRSDIIVEIDGDRFKINVFDPTRLMQDIETELETNACYTTDPNLIIVKEVTKETIEKTLEHQARQGYFDMLKNHGFDKPWRTNCMNDFVLNLHSLALSERSNLQKVGLVQGETVPRVTAIRLRTEAMKYCKGPRALLLENESAQETMEGSCEFSLFRETQEEMSGCQIFALYNYGEQKPEKDLVVIRKGSWARGSDMEALKRGESLVHPTCEGASALLKGEAASQILAEVKQIGDLFYHGFSYSEAKDKPFHASSLKVVDSAGISHEIQWDSKRELLPIEERIEKLTQCIEQRMNPKAENGLKLIYIF